LYHNMINELKMKIFLVIPTLYPGGAERVMSILANNWAKKHAVEVEILLLANGSPFYKIDDRVKITNLGFKTNEHPFLRIISLFKLFFKFRNYVKKNRPDFVLCFMTKNNIFTLLSLLNCNIKTFVSERDSPTEKIPWITSFLRNKVYRFAEGIICQSKMSKEFIENETESKNVISIPNPLVVVEDNNPYNRDKIILNVGRLVEKKGQKYLIEAFSNLKCPDWKLVFLGDGHLKDELMEQVDMLGLRESIIFNGTVSNVSDWYQKSAIFAFPSILEGYPNALAEAMCNGLACVSFDCYTGPSDIIRNGVNGFLIEEKNVAHLTQKLQLLIDDEELRVNYSNEAFKLNKIVDQNVIASDYFNFCVSSIC